MRAFWIVFVLLGVPAQDADEQYTYVAALAEKGLHDRVVREAQSFLREHAGHAKAPLARYRLACALFELRKEAEARPHFVTLAREPDFEFGVEAQFRLAQCLLAAGDRTEAEAALARVIRPERGGKAEKEYLRAPALSLLAQSELARKEHALALEHFEALALLRPSEALAAEARSGQAWCLHRLGRHAEAAAAARAGLAEASKAGRDGPDAAPSGAPGAEAVAQKYELAFLLGECLLDLQDPRAALTAFREVRAGPYADSALRGAGFALAALGDHRGAAREFARVLAEHPESAHRAECALQEGVALLAAGDARAAVQALARPEIGASAEALAWRARAEAAAEEPAAALATLDRALALKPGRELEQRLVLQRADLLVQLGRAGEARADYERAGTDRALLAAAVHALTGKRHDEAIGLAARMLERFPESPLWRDGLLALGEGLFGAQRWNEAEEALLAAAEGDDEPLRRTRALARAAWSAYLGGAFERAAERFELAARGADELQEVEEAAFMAGRAREDAHDIEGARSAFGRALQRFPRGPHAEEAAMRIALLGGAGPEGLRELEALAGRARAGPLGARVHFELAERRSAAGEHARALEAYRQVLASAPSADLAARARYGLAWSAFQLRQLDACEAALAELLAAGEVPAALRSAGSELAAWTAIERGDLERALSRWGAWLAAEHDEPRAGPLLRALVAALDAAGKKAESRAAVDAFAAAARTPAGRRRAALERVLLLADSGDPEAAELEFARLRSDAETGGVRAAGGAANTAGADANAALVAEAAFRLGEARFAEGADALAIAHYDVAARVAEGPIAASALYKAGFARLRAGDAAGAELSLATLVERHPKSELWIESLFLLGEARFRQDKVPAAIEVLERVRREGARHQVLPKALFRLGVAYGKAERWKESVDTLGELVKREKDFANTAEAELWRGRGLAALEDRRGARAAFERVLALDKGQLSAEAHLELGRLLFEAGDADGALSEFLKVAVLYAGDEEVCEALVLAGQVLEAEGQKDRAIEQYRAAQKEHPKAKYAREAARRLTALGAH